MRAPREAPPPGHYGRSPSGVAFEITQVSHRDANGHKLYRLYYLESGVRGTQEWTIEQLVAANVRFLRRRPKSMNKVQAKPRSEQCLDLSTIRMSPS